jgi:2-keto-4-pentenoate hydratase
MLTETAARAACDRLAAHWEAGTVLQALAPDERPQTRAEGYAVQAHLERHTKAPVFGWKIAATSIAGQTHIGVDGPLAGRIRAEHVVSPGSSLNLSGNRMRVAEVEYAFRFAADLAPRAHAYTQAEVLAAVGSLHPALEIPDSRFSDFVTAGAAQLIADAACGWRFALGEAAPPSWRAMDLAAHRPVARMGDGRVIEGHGFNVLGDPRIALTWIANELSRFGPGLRAGQVVTTGTCLVPIAIGPGDSIEADYPSLGRIALRFA